MTSADSGIANMAANHSLKPGFSGIPESEAVMLAGGFTGDSKYDLADERKLYHAHRGGTRIRGGKAPHAL